jgi:hypothetical protein
VFVIKYVALLVVECETQTIFFGGIALVAVAAAMAFNVSLNLNKNNDSLLLALANM